VAYRINKDLEYPHYLNQAQFQEYIESYATHYDLHRNIVFHAHVKKVVRNNDDTKWLVHLIVNGEARVEEVDKVAFCHGYQTHARMPTFEGAETFHGSIIHAQQFRSLVNALINSGISLLTLEGPRTLQGRMSSLWDCQAPLVTFSILSSLSQTSSTCHIAEEHLLYFRIEMAILLICSQPGDVARLHLSWNASCQ
jgi:hypothetical protein